MLQTSNSQRLFLTKRYLDRTMSITYKVDCLEEKLSYIKPEKISCSLAATKYIITTHVIYILHIKTNTMVYRSFIHQGVYI